MIGMTELETNLAALTARYNVQLKSFPPDLVAAARSQATDVLSEVAARSDIAKRIHASYTAFRERMANWSRISLRAVLQARDG